MDCPECSCHKITIWNEQETFTEYKCKCCGFVWEDQ
jgi:transcription initiation factor TFIIIB Brf1 subunit/transcription initiation factor TFIIB